MRYPRAAIGIGLVIALGVAVSAEQRGTVTLNRPPATGRSNALKFSAPWTPEGGGSTRIIGTVIDIKQTPVAKVKVRLRNISTGEIMAETESDGNGEYAFPELEPGLYVVEMFIDNRYVVALSNTGTVARFETLQTVVQLPGRWDLGSQSVIAENAPTTFMGMSAATTFTAATLVTAVTQEIPTTDQGVLTSPQ
jgi:hypothetical protein